jgi:plastocyanin
MRPSRPVLVVAALALALLGAATAGVVARAGVTKSTITVTEREFRITPSTRKAAKGRVRIVVKNAGKYPHALAIRGAGVNKRTSVIKPGKSAVLLVDLRSGSYSLWCPVPGHAARGMKATLSLVAASTSPTTHTTTTGDTTTETDPIPGY